MNTESITESNYVDIAEQSIKKLLGKPDERGKYRKIVSTSKLRGLLAMVSDIYNDVLNENQNTLPPNLTARISYMKVRFYYEAGRDREKTVRALLETARVFELLDAINGKKDNFILFSRYMEALVAFRKFYVEEDD